MPRRYINELQPGDRVEDEVFLIKSKDLRTTTQGGLYIHAVLVDKTGQMPARMWQASQEIFEEISEGGFLRLKGRAENYKGNMQFIIDALRKAEPGSFNVADFLPVTSGNSDSMWSRLREILREIRQPELKALVEEFLSDSALMEQFRKAPAAATLHHAYLGGLLEHTLSLLEVGLRVIPLYPQLNLDLVLTGLFLHDIGKSVELTYETSIGYSDSGQLLGHITQAVLWIDKKADAVAVRTGNPFPETMRWALQHIVLSHHGQYEFGSPKLPAIPEAVAVHYLDNLDAKINVFLTIIENDRDTVSHWTNYNTALQTKVYKLDAMGMRANKGAVKAAK
ncbi:MAG: HD domain-containing protein [Planctomycetota bacterium]